MHRGRTARAVDRLRGPVRNGHRGRPLNSVVRAQRNMRTLARIKSISLAMAVGALTTIAVISIGAMFFADVPAGAARTEANFGARVEAIESCEPLKVFCRSVASSHDAQMQHIAFLNRHIDAVLKNAFLLILGGSVVVTGLSLYIFFAVRKLENKGNVAL